jgi:hypothetical protein
MGERCIEPYFLTSALDGGEWSVSRTGRFTPGERARGTHWIGGWMGPRGGLDAVEKRKILSCRVYNPDCPTRSPSLYRLSYRDSSYSVSRRMQRKKGEAIPVTGHVDPCGCETSRLPHFLDNRLTVMVSLSALRAGRPLTPRKIPGTHFS